MYLVLTGMKKKKRTKQFHNKVTGAARFITGNYLMETGNTKLNLDKLEWPTLEERRLQTKLTSFQKCRLKHIDVPTDHLTSLLII